MCVPSTNNGLEATNKHLKEGPLQYNQQPLGEFLETVEEQIIQKWSEERDSISVNCKQFNHEPAVGTAEFTEAWKWPNKKKDCENKNKL